MAINNSILIKYLLVLGPGYLLKCNVRTHSQQCIYCRGTKNLSEDETVKGVFTPSPTQSLL